MKYFILISTLVMSQLSATIAQYKLEEAFPGLKSFINPVELVTANDGSNRMFLLEQTGKIYVFENKSDVKTKTLFLDISNIVCKKYSETGLLGMTLHPKFKTNGTFYLNYDTDLTGKLQSVIAAYKVDINNPNLAVKSSEKRLLVVDDLESNHNGGCIHFGPDGYLYFSLGDGGSGNDPWNNSQNLKVYWGKIHRINIADTTNGKKYGIPADNPFVNTTDARPEIYAYGLRNVWRFNFDLEDNNKLWAADVGQNNWEEIDIITKGGNYGWKIMEGLVCRPGGDKNCDRKGLIDPVWVYPRNDGTSITGGFVYRGSKLEELKGKYIYADYTFGNIWALEVSGKKAPINTKIIDRDMDLPKRISSFAQDFDKELLVLSYGHGKILRLVRESATANKPATVTKSLEVKINPNPTKDIVNISLSTATADILEIVIRDSNGKSVSSVVNEKRVAGNHTFNVETNKFSAGLYYVHIRSGVQETIQKFVKTN